MGEKNESDQYWSLDRRLPVATLIALILQTATIVWWASALQSTVYEQGRVLNEVKQFGSPITRDRLAALEAAAQSYRTITDRIDLRFERLDTKVDRLTEELSRARADRVPNQ